MQGTEDPADRTADGAGSIEMSAPGENGGRTGIREGEAEKWNCGIRSFTQRKCKAFCP